MSDQSSRHPKFLPLPPPPSNWLLLYTARTPLNQLISADTQPYLCHSRLILGAGYRDGGGAPWTPSSGLLACWIFWGTKIYTDFKKIVCPQAVAQFHSIWRNWPGFGVSQVSLVPLLGESWENPGALATRRCAGLNTHYHPDGGSAELQCLKDTNGDHSS